MWRTERAPSQWRRNAASSSSSARRELRIRVQSRQMAHCRPFQLRSRYSIRLRHFKTGLYAPIRDSSPQLEKHRSETPAKRAQVVAVQHGVDGLTIRAVATDVVARQRSENKRSAIGCDVRDASVNFPRCLAGVGHGPIISCACIQRCAFEASGLAYRCAYPGSATCQEPSRQQRYLGRDHRNAASCLK